MALLMGYCTRTRLRPELPIGMQHHPVIGPAQTGKNNSRKDWLFARNRASLLALVEGPGLSGTPALPASVAVRGCGGDGAHCRRQPKGDPDHVTEQTYRHAACIA